MHPLRPAISSGFAWFLVVILAPIYMGAAGIAVAQGHGWDHKASLAAVTTVLIVAGAMWWHLRRRHSTLLRPPAALTHTSLLYFPQGRRDQRSVTFGAVRKLQRIPGKSLHIDTGSDPVVLLDSDFVGDTALDLVAQAIQRAVAARPGGAHLNEEIEAQQQLAAEFGKRSIVVTISLLVVIGILFGIELATAAIGQPGQMLRLGANAPELVRAGQWWRLVTAGLLHVNVQHVMLNAAALFFTGAILEKLVGRARFVVIALTASIVGNVASTLFGSFSMSIGASSCIFGLLGALLVVQHTKHATLPLALVVAPKRWVYLLGLNALISLLPGIDLSAHVGGFLAGALLGAAFVPGLNVRALSAAPLVRISAALLVAIFIAAFAYAFQRGPVASDLQAIGAWTSGAPDIGDTALIVKDLPGFSIALPDGEVSKQLDYQTGRYHVLKKGGEKTFLVGVSWFPGETSRDGLLTTAKMVSAPLGATTPQQRVTAGPRGRSVDTVVLETANESMHIAHLTCGRRVVQVMAVGDAGIATLFAHIIASFSCQPDSGQEAASPWTPPIVLDLPGWFIEPHGTGQLTLTDGTSFLMLWPSAAKVDVDDTVFINALNATGMNLALGPLAGDYATFSGTLSDSNRVDGWFKQIACGELGMVMLIAFAPDKSMAGRVAAQTSSARCRTAAEHPQSWPEAPPQLGPP